MSPAFLFGEFMDDYGIRYTITPELWLQRPNARYHVVMSMAGERTLVARNDASNPGEGGLWTRIDWVRLEEGGEYEWAYCLAVYDAPTQEAALAAPPSGRDAPRAGCNGFPFSRMKRVDP
jgi:hypothetical protein